MDIYTIDGVALLGHEAVHIEQQVADLRNPLVSVLLYNVLYGREYLRHRMHHESHDDAYEHSAFEAPASEMEDKIREDLQAKFPNGIPCKQCQ